MAVLVTYGDRLLTTTGRASWLKRPSVPLAQFGRGNIPLSGSGTMLSFLAAYESQPWIAAAVNKLNRGIMDLPLRLYREVTDDGEIEPVYRHPVLDLVTRPWTRGSASDLKQKMSHPALIHGNSVLGKVRAEANGPPVAFVPLDWRFLTAYTLDDGEVFFWETTQPNRQQFWAPEDVIHFAFEAGNGDMGVSPLKQLARTVSMEDASQRYQAGSFANGIRPSGALVMPEGVKMGEEALERLRSKLQAQKGGVDQTALMMLLEGGLDWKPFSHTAVEAELIEQRKLNREEAAAVYDVDPPLIGILDHATYSNVSEMHNRFYRATLRPWLTLLTDTLNAQLVAMEPAWRDERVFLAFDLSDVLRSDTPEEITAVGTAIGTGVMTPNEGRNRLRMRKSDNPAADELYMPSNNLTVMGAPTEPDTAPEPPPIEAEDEESVAKRHVDRAKRLIQTKMGAGEPWDKARFVRELYEDAPGVDGFAVAAHLEQAIQDADGSPSAFRRLSDAI
jgi:HK97 family phage portal protein